MKLYLVRHGQAMHEKEDPARPLSAEGRRDVEKVAGLIGAHFAVLPGYIYHSPKARAAQTAAIFAGTLPNAPAAVEHGGLLPMDDPAHWAQSAASFDRDLMLVGHLPFMGRLASLLLTWDAGKDLVEFAPGTVACLEKTGRWRLKWLVGPAALRRQPT